MAFRDDWGDEDSVLWDAGLGIRFNSGCKGIHRRQLGGFRGVFLDAASSILSFLFLYWEHGVFSVLPHTGLQVYSVRTQRSVVVTNTTNLPVSQDVICSLVSYNSKYLQLE